MTSTIFTMKRIVSALLISSALFITLPTYGQTTMTPKEGVKKLAEFLYDLYDNTLKALDTLELGKKPTQTLVGGKMTEKLESMAKSIEKIEVPTLDDFRKVTTLAKLLSSDIELREKEISKADTYATGKAEEIKDAKATLESLTAILDRANASGQGLRKLSKGLQDIPLADGITLKVLQEYIFDLEVNLIPGTNSVCSALTSKKKELSAAIEKTSTALKNLNGNLATIRELTEDEKAKTKAANDLIESRKKLTGEIEAHKTAVQNYNNEVGAMQAEQKVLQAEQQAIEALRFTGCPNGKPFEQCDHHDAKQRWINDRNARVNAFNNRGAQFQQKAKGVEATRNALAAKESEIQRSMKAQEEQLKKLSEADREKQAGQLEKLRSLLPLLDK